MRGSSSSSFGREGVEQGAGPRPPVGIARVAGELLQHQARGAGVVGGEQQPGGQLLGLEEVVLEGRPHRAAFQRDQALVALGVAPVRGRVFDGDRQDRIGPEVGQALRRGLLVVELRDPAQRARRRAFGEQGAQRAVAAQLHGQAPIDLRVAGEQRRRGRGFAEQARDAGRVRALFGRGHAVADLAPRGVEVDAHAAHAGFGEEEARQAVVVTVVVRDVGVGHLVGNLHRQ